MRALLVIVAVGAGLVGALTSAAALALLGGSATVGARMNQGRIAFERGGQIYVIKAAGSSGLTRLRFRTTVKPDWANPAWSPNGNRLAVVGHLENGTLDGDTRIYVRGTGGRTRAIFISDVGTGGVSWSPNGMWLAHDTGRDEPTPILIRLRTGKEYPVGKSLAKSPIGINATWSPDGKSLAFHYAKGLDGAGFPIWRGIATVRTDGSNFKPLTQSGDNPDWSPDGAKIAFGSQGILTVDRDHHVARLTAAGDNPSWSPDGSRIVFERRNDLWIMDRNGSHQQILVRNSRAPDWSR